MSEHEMARHLKDGEAHLSAGRLEDAMRSFELALEQAPDSHRAIYFSALTHLKLGQEATALVQFNRALELDPNNPNYLSDLAVTKVRLGDKVGAMRDLDRCVELQPDYSYRYALRAFVRSSLGDLQGAVDDYRKAVELDPEDAIALNNLGMAEEKLGYEGRAQELFAKADRIMGLPESPRDHTIDLSSSRKKAGSGKEKEDTDTPNVPAHGFREYWSTILKVFTEKGQRDEFLRFTGSLFKQGAK